jgi:DNA-directed RNA polymerase subunit RPC12/RpoP
MTRRVESIADDAAGRCPGCQSYCPWNPVTEAFVCHRCSETFGVDGALHVTG